jgi:hypothetical protein
MRHAAIVGFSSAKTQRSLRKTTLLRSGRQDFDPLGIALFAVLFDPHEPGLSLPLGGNIQFYLQERIAPRHVPIQARSFAQGGMIGLQFGADTDLAVRLIGPEVQAPNLQPFASVDPVRVEPVDDRIGRELEGDRVAEGRIGHHVGGREIPTQIRIRVVHGDQVNRVYAEPGRVSAIALGDERICAVRDEVTRIAVVAEEVVEFHLHGRVAPGGIGCGRICPLGSDKVHETGDPAFPGDAIGCRVPGIAKPRAGQGNHGTAWSRRRRKNVRLRQCKPDLVAAFSTALIDSHPIVSFHQRTTGYLELDLGLGPGEDGDVCPRMRVALAHLDEGVFILLQSKIFTSQRHEGATPSRDWRDTPHMVYGRGVGAVPEANGY